MPVRTWSFDYAHSAVNFVARHMVVARVYGRFNRFAGTLRVDPDDLATGEVEVHISADSVDTNNVDRDNHLRSPEFLDVEKHPEVIFKSRRVEGISGGSFRVVGDLSIRGLTKPITLEARNLGVMTDPSGKKRILFNARGTVNRSEYGITWNKALDNGGWLVGEKIDLELDAQAVEAAETNVA